MYKCKDCGCEFEEPKAYTDSHGSPYPHWETIYRCPECGGDYAKAEKCRACGELTVDEVDGVCYGCLLNLDNLIKFGEQENDINHFLKNAYGISDINAEIEQRVRKIMNAKSGYDVQIKQILTKDIENYVSTYAHEIVDFILGC